MANAKTASKNNPTTRAKAKEFFYQNKKVVPVKFFSESGNYMAAQFENGDMPLNKNGNPINWAQIKN